MLLPDEHALVEFSSRVGAEGAIFSARWGGGCWSWSAEQWSVPGADLSRQASFKAEGASATVAYAAEDAIEALREGPPNSAIGKLSEQLAAIGILPTKECEA